MIESIPIEDKTDELLLNVDGDDSQNQPKNPCNQILADLTDLRFDEKNNENDSEEKEIEGKTDFIISSNIDRTSPLIIRITLQSRSIILKTFDSRCGILFSLLFRIKCQYFLFLYLVIHWRHLPVKLSIVPNGS